ncbi:Lipid-A-disaccharide synthase [uncultured Desulfobacterium sp.]|uniref:Lipid-A-disaccharide synthase n=1 Tax=uncultured Desulfobacterium sp. TaxID=201089 RepID=A0A445N0F4_9BACT|nr:Lipid-A-disaccharide synthase [uncultured Desulfobacterium sp.]
MNSSQPISGDSRLVLIVAGEASADLHGSNLVTAIKGIDPTVIFKGIGGEKMRKAGVELLASSSDMAVVGLTEVFSKLSFILRAAKKIKSSLKNDHPDLLILIDYPEFNIHIAGTAKRYNVPVLYYISPQIWAWRKGRIRKIARRIDRMAVILPFEKDFYRKSPLKVDYVGHPLLDTLPQDQDKAKVIAELDVEQSYPVVGLLPGSRKDEIKNLLPVMVDAAGILRKKYPQLRCALPLAPGISREFVQPFIEISKVSIRLYRGDIYNLLNICDAAMVTSGTATLQVAIMGVPMVIVYKMSPLSYHAARLFIDVPFIGLVNLVGGERVATELIQDQVTPQRLADEVGFILEDKKARETMINKLMLVRDRLGKGGASLQTARIALEMMDSKREKN